MLSYPNGLSASFNYFPNTGDHRLQAITNLNPGSSLVSQFGYAYDAVGRVTQWTENNPALSGSEAYNFLYDGSDELTSAQLSGTGSVTNLYAYSYDGAGNRISAQNNFSISSSMVNDLNQLTSSSGSGTMLFSGTLVDPAVVTIDGNPASSTSLLGFSGTAAVATGTNVVTLTATDQFSQSATQRYQVVVPSVSGTYTYDLNGNLVSDGVMTYVWDAANRLIAVNEPGNLSSEFTYDGFGRRTSVVEYNNGVLTSTKNLLWSGMRICEERDGSNNVTKRYFSQGVQLSGSSYCYTFDHLGSVRELVDANNIVQARYDYDPYGVQTQLTGTLAADFGYTGQYFHHPSGLMLAPYRGYSALEGRWISRDPLDDAEMKEGPNLYEYVWNNPIRWVDPLGLGPVPHLNGTPSSQCQWDNAVKNTLKVTGGIVAAAGGVTGIVGGASAIGAGAYWGGGLATFAGGTSLALSGVAIAGGDAPGGPGELVGSMTGNQNWQAIGALGDAAMGLGDDDLGNTLTAAGLLLNPPTGDPNAGFGVGTHPKKCP